MNRLPVTETCRKELPRFGACVARQGGRESEVCLATRYGMDGQGIESRWGGGGETTQSPAPWVPGLFTESKAAGAWR